MFHSIRSKIMAVTTAIVIITLSANTIVNYLIINKFNNSAIENSLTALTKSHSATINQWINTKKSQITSLVSHVTDSDPVPLLKQTAEAGHFMNVDIGYPDKRNISSDPSDIPEGYDPTSRPWYISAVQAGKPLILKPYVDASIRSDDGKNQPQKLIVTVAAPHIAENGAVLGVVEGDIHMKDVVENIRSIQPTPGSFGMLIAGDGTILAHPDDTLTLTLLNDQLSEQDTKRLLEANGSVQGEINGQVKLLHALPVGDSGWYVVVVMDKAEATAGVRSLLKASVFCLLCLIVFAAVVTNIMSKRSLKPLDTVRIAMEKIASGEADLTGRLDVSRRDEVAAIARAFNAFITALGKIMGSVLHSSQAVRHASHEITQGNQTLSAQTESAAASLQQTSAAIEQISSTISLMADTAEKVNQTIVGTEHSVSKGQEAITKMNHTFSDIEAASEKIANITSVIENIAFQSNILALNAAVEAAHAGESGKGFAVVATEVRELAQKSTQAAYDIKVLIDSTVNCIRLGSQQVTHTDETMKHIVNSVGTVSAMIGEITTATREQQFGIDEINQAVVQLDTMVQQNTVLAEESTATSATMEEQAEGLAIIVGKFKI